jgi:superfamily I DNA/RNA helicase
MQSRLAAPLWNRQRKTAGYDYVFVDETHLFNENERRVLPYLTRGSEDNVPIIMAFDEAQSIGGRRASELEEVGIRNSEQRRLSYVHRSSPQIYRLARDLIERSTLMFSEFSDSESMARMSERDLKKCRPPVLLKADGRLETAGIAADIAIQLRTKNYPRIGIITFEGKLVDEIAAQFAERNKEGQVLKERGDSLAGKPFPGIFIMTAEHCGGLEFDAVILAGVDSGQVPPSLHNISPEGHLSVREEACKELYTALTRARYHVAFVCDRSKGPSEFIRPWIDTGLVEERTQL